MNFSKVFYLTHYIQDIIISHVTPVTFQVLTSPLGAAH